MRNCSSLGTPISARAQYFRQRRRLFLQGACISYIISEEDSAYRIEIELSPTTEPGCQARNSHPCCILQVGHPVLSLI